MEIFIEHKPSPAKLEVIGVYDWPIWEKAVATFACHYEQQETCYILKGEVEISTESGGTYLLKRGDLVTFSAGLKCHWKITKAIKKYYNTGN